MPNEKLRTPLANADGTYLPMPWTGARRMETERLVYRERQRLHHARFPNYAIGWRRPSEATTSRVWALVERRATRVTGGLSAIDRQALVMALDSAIQAGQDGRLLTHNLIFDAVASAWSDHYRAACERGPARVSWEMSADTLKGAWRDLSRNEVDLKKLIAAAQNGCGLYTVKKGRDDRHTVELDGATSERREKFLRIVADDTMTGGTYRRRSSLRRLRPACDPGTDDGLLDESEVGDEVLGTSTRKVVAEVAYNVAIPGERSVATMRHLEAARLYLNAEALRAEHKRLWDEVERVFVTAYERYGVDLTKPTAKVERTVVDAGTGKRRKGYWRSEWERHVLDVLGRRPDQNKKRAVIALACKYDKLIGQARQLGPSDSSAGVVQQVEKIAKSGGLDESGEVEICTRYAKLSNRRFQALDFWMTEVSGKDDQSETLDLGPAGYPSGPDDLDEPPIEMTVTSSRRGRFFRIAASVAEEARRAERLYATAADEPLNEPVVGDRQELVGVDVSGSQIQIYAVLLGLDGLERRLRTMPYKEIAALRAWERHHDPRDPFVLPADHDYGDASDPRLMEATKTATMTWLYGSPPNMIVERLAQDRDEVGAGLGTAENLGHFLLDSHLELDRIAKLWKPACQRIAERAWKGNQYAGITLTDPFDKAGVRWNPIRWKPERVAGSDDVRIYAKVPIGTKNSIGEFPVYRHKLATTFGPCFIHMLDSLFCGLVIEELQRLDVPAVVSIHDAWYVSADAKQELAAAVAAAGRPWFEALGGVYDDLDRLLGTCTPPTHGKRKGKCCGYCGNWIRELRSTWKHRMAAGDWPKFKVGPVRLVERTV